ncbi:type I-D CRISPR-associated protein Cas5/Csc1 [Methylacidiphilum caldifontis]|uniref:Type I-D CRISPR-associated protein Cas5/Csc1 n=1 Tax=Methylacidiphilum caldifontis TaxID=2795386 RepID=A0A4Y8PBB5_9BACT|nr:type I-D CRISPR-associated protein Cas5/Csc1 [Methylacidiphilum caldifontis]TFE67813.1 type I-D CRISPR-associated protein Cas5/Csc1 [Methylacidiphilum caldifontis]
MRIYKIKIDVHDNIYFATREAGRLYETEKYIHNYALTYALGLVKDVPFYNLEQIPRYMDDLKKLSGIYVSPASPIKVRYDFLTFKFGNERNHIKELKLSENIPNFGKSKELAVESELVFFLFVEEWAVLPSYLKQWLDSDRSFWVRLGKWMSKAELKAKCASEIRNKSGEFLVSFALNPLDLPQSPDVFDIVSMPPVSLITNVRIKGDYFELSFEKETIILPSGMDYFKIDKSKCLTQ